MAKKKHSLRSFAPELGISKSRLGQLRQEPWWPTGNKEWDVDACKAAINANVGSYSKPGASPSPPATSQRPERKEPPSELIDPLRDPSAGPVEIAEAMLRALSWRTAEGLATDTIGASESSKLLEAMESLRKAKAAQIKIDVERGRLIDRERAAAAGAELARRLVEILNRLGVDLINEAERWACDPRHRELTSEARALEVRRWYEARTRALREAESRDLERLLEGAA